MAHKRFCKESVREMLTLLMGDYYDKAIRAYNQNELYVCVMCCYHWLGVNDALETIGLTGAPSLQHKMIQQLIYYSLKQGGVDDET